MRAVAANAGTEDAANIFARRESRVRSYARAFPALFARAEGVHLIGADGRRWLDGLAGAGSLNYGHNHPELARALVDYIQSGGITHSLDLHTTAKAAFLERFDELVLAPRGLDYLAQFTGPTGTNAVEAALKLARKVTGRTDVVAFTNGFHGVSLGALAATANGHHRGAAGVPLGHVQRLPYDGYLGSSVDTLAWFERLLDDPGSGVAPPAAAIVETVQGEGGLRVASANWLRGLAQLCRRHGVLLIVDDIQAGCGRTGTFFSFEAAGIVPDIVTLSKSLSGFGLPLSLVLFRPVLDAWEPGEHNGTFRGNNHAFVTATRALELFWSDDRFAATVAARARALEARLVALAGAYPERLAVRGRGMLRGLACRRPAAAGEISARAFDDGLVVETCGPRDEVVKLMFPLVIDEAELDQGLDILERAVTATCAREHA